MHGHKLVVVFVLTAALCANLGCTFGQRPPPNTMFDIAVVNDKPSTGANFSVLITGNSILAGSILSFFIPIDQTGKGAIRVDTRGHGPVDITDFVCGSGLRPPQLQDINFRHIVLSNNPKRTVDCQFTRPIPAAAGWVSFSDSMDKVHLDENPQVPMPLEASTASPYDELNREAAARSFLSEHRTYERQASVLHDWLLNTTPPDNTILQNLEAGQSTESQIVLIASGAQFFAASNNDNSTFVRNTHRALLNRDPAQWELDSAVQDLNGYWYFVEQSCEEGCLWIMEGYYYCPEPRPTPPCGHWEYYQKTREQFASETVSTHEFHQVASRFMYGIQNRRIATTTEIEDQAYYVGSMGLKEGAVRLLKSLEYFQKSTQPF